MTSLMAENIEQLQHLMNILQIGLGKVGLQVNLQKSFALVWVKDKKKKIIYDSTAVLKCYNQPFPVIKADSEFTYFGACITPSGLAKINTTTLQEKIDTLLKAPAKPQQTLFMLKNFLLPSFYHEYIFSRLYAKYLNKIDIIIRKTVRHILDLPKAAFHTRVADRGLEDPCTQLLDTYHSQ